MLTKSKQRLTKILLLSDLKMGLTNKDNVSLDQIRLSHEAISKSVIDPAIYKTEPLLQHALLEDSKFAWILCDLLEHGYKASQIIDLYKAITSYNEKMSSFSTSELIEAITLPISYSYLYLKYFAGKGYDEKSREIIGDNLWTWVNSREEEEDFPVEAVFYFLLPHISKSGFIPTANLTATIKTVAKSHELQDFIEEMSRKEIDIYTTESTFQHIAENIEYYHRAFLLLYSLLGYDGEVLSALLDLWQENSSLKSDMDLLLKLEKLPLEHRRKTAVNKASYINYICGTSYDMQGYVEENESCEDILIYAIKHKKKAFIRLIETNKQYFNELPWDSLLFQKEFYERYVNINGLSLNNLKDCKILTGPPLVLPVGTYTFEEVKALHGMPREYAELYGFLTIGKIDTKLLTVRQLAKRSLLKDIDKDLFSGLARLLDVKTIYGYLEQDFAHISSCTVHDCVQILANYDVLSKFVPEIKDRQEVSYLARNKEKARKYTSLKEFKNDICSQDSSWELLREKMDFTEEFLQDKQEAIYQFLLREGASMATTYHDKLSDTKQEQFARIIKALLAGSYNTLKYYDDDLFREIDFRVTQEQKDIWCRNTRLEDGAYTAAECDDFYDTMQIGAKPYQTCLYYDGGAWAECLLSCFDSNKKVVNVYKEDTVVARALVRLTKGSYSPPDKADNSSLTFIDIEQPAPKKQQKKEECLVLFLERSYTAGLSPAEVELAESLIIRLCEKRARELGALLVLSASYNASDKYILTKLYLFVSKSKGGSQYMDSLSGSASVQDEGSYRSNRFYIRQSACDSFLV